MIYQLSETDKACLIILKSLVVIVTDGTRKNVVSV